MDLRLARNACANLMGAVVPAAVALGTVPLVVRGLGNASYGVYALVTAIVGYFAVIDINVTAGSVKFIAEFNARGERASVAGTVCFGVAVYAVAGLAGALGLYIGAGYLVRHVFTVPLALVPVAVTTLKVAAFGFCAGQLQAYLHSVPQSLMRYDVASRFEIAFGTVVPLLTVGVLLLGYGLVEVIALRVAASVLNCLLLWRAIHALLPGLRPRWPGARLRAALLGFSAYSFLSRFAALSYAYADKLIIGALVGVTGLAYFTVASTLANRVLGLTWRLSGVFFPAASALAAGGELARLDRLYLKASRYVVFANGAILVLVAVYAEPILRYWMNPEFARHGRLVLSVMALSQFIDSFTSLPSLVNDGMGHPRTSGLFALLRALFGLLVVYAGVLRWGIDGAAWGHLAGSLLFSAAFVAWVHGRTVPTRLRDLLRRAYAPALSGIVAIALAAAAAQRLWGGAPRVLLLLVLLTIAALAAWGVLVVAEQGDRALAWARLKALAPPRARRRA